MLWLKAWHIIFMVTWMAGLFYLPRLYVYHADVDDAPSNQRFKLMERRLYYGITTPGGVLTTLSGMGLLYLKPYLLAQTFMQLKLIAVLALWGYHWVCGHYRKRFAADATPHSSTFYRWFNEAPTVLLIGIVLLIVIQPNLA